MAKSWTYDLTIHNAAGLMDPEALANESGESADGSGVPNVISCDQQGRCFFDEVIRPNAWPLLDLLNRRGAEGWEMIQFAVHEGHLYVFWKREA